MKIIHFVYKSLLTGMPTLTYNPFRQNAFLAPFDVRPGSVYLNYELSKKHVFQLQSLIEKENVLETPPTIVPISIIKDEEPKYYLSVNIYTCTSPIFLGIHAMTRCEINTYVRDDAGNLATVILDYASDALSMDPVNLFKQKENVWLSFTTEPCLDNTERIYFKIKCKSKNFNLFANLRNRVNLDSPHIRLHPNLHTATDIIYYTNGIYDKMFFDSSLIDGKIQYLTQILKDETPQFNFHDILFHEPKHMFYFEDTLSFTASMWHNVYSDKIKLNQDTFE